MQKVSRHRLAEFIAERFVAGSFKKEEIRETAAYLIENHQVDQAELLLSDISAILASKHNVLLAEVISARPLEASVRKSVIEYIKKTENVDKVELNESVDKSLIGGVIIRTPTAEFDSSVRSQLRHLRSIKENKE